MRKARLSLGCSGAATAWFVASCWLLGACQLLGPQSIESGRGSYNDIIHETTINQMLANLVRVYNNEPTLLLDIGEVDAAQSFSGGLSGGETNIGGRAGHNSSTAGSLFGPVGGVAGSVQYSESPTIRYVPLSGQPLIAQLVTPLDAAKLPQLLNSNWPVSSVFDLAVQNFLLDHDEFFSALDALIALQKAEATHFAVGKSKWTTEAKPPPPGTYVVQMQGQQPAGDTLFVYLLPPHTHGQDTRVPEHRRRLQWWVRLLRLFAGTQPHPEFTNWEKCKTLPTFTPKHRPENLKENQQLLEYFDENIDQIVRSKDNVAPAFACLRTWIELRSAPVNPDWTEQHSAPPITRPCTRANTQHSAPQQANQKADQAEAQFKQLESYSPMLRTMSAIGILKNSVDLSLGPPRIEFVTRRTFDTITSYKWNKDTESLNYYTLKSTDLGSASCRAQKCEELAEEDLTISEKYDVLRTIDKWVDDSSRCTLPDLLVPEADNGLPIAYEADNPCDPPNNLNFLDNAHIETNNWLGYLRRYVLVIVDDHPPAKPPYAEYRTPDGKYYYIDDKDAVSKRNFQLLLELMTIMAVPPTTPPLTPSINVGG